MRGQCTQAGRSFPLVGAHRRRRRGHVVDVERHDTGLGERHELARRAAAVLVAIGPQDELSESSVSCIDPSVVIFVELCEPIEAEQLAFSFDAPAAVAVEREPRRSGAARFERRRPGGVFCDPGTKEKRPGDEPGPPVCRK